MVKMCSKCKKTKTLDSFSKRKKNKDGLNGQCKACVKLYHQEYRERNQEYFAHYIKNWKKENPEKEKNNRKNWAKNNPEKVRKIKKRWNDKTSYNTKYHFKRRKKDVQFKIATNLRSRLNQAIKNGFKSGSAVKDLGCNIKFLKDHLENQFTEGMTWDNYGKWHIDHIIPLSSFNLAIRAELLKACHYTNLQPLWAKENLIKYNKTQRSKLEGLL